MQQMQPSSEISPLLADTACEQAAKANSRIDRLSGSAHHAVNRIAEAVSSVARQLDVTGNKLVTAQHRWTESSRSTVCRHPVASVAVAVVAGLLLSRWSAGKTTRRIQ